MPGIKTLEDLKKEPRVKTIEEHMALEYTHTSIREMVQARWALDRMLSRIIGVNQTMSHIKAATPKAEFVNRITMLQKRAVNHREGYDSLADDAEISMQRLKTNRLQNSGIATLQVIIATGKLSEFCLSILPLTKQGMMLKEELEGWFRAMDIVDTVGSAAKAAYAKKDNKDGEAAIEAIATLTKAADLFGVKIKELGGCISALYNLQKGTGSTLTDKIKWLASCFSLCENLAKVMGELIEAMSTVSKTSTRLKALSALIGPVVKLLELFEESLKAHEEIQRAIESNRQVSKAETHLAKMRTTTAVSDRTKEALEKFDFDLAKFDKECTDDAKSLRGILHSVRNRSDAKAWSKVLTDRLAQMKQKQRQLLRQREQAREQYQKDLKELPNAYVAFEKAQAFMLKQLDLVSRKVNFAKAQSVLTGIIDAIAFNLHKNNVTRNQYHVHWARIIYASSK